MIEALREEDTAAAMIKAAREGDKHECERLLANDGELKNAKGQVRKEHTAKHETKQLHGATGKGNGVHSCWMCLSVMK